MRIQQKQAGNRGMFYVEGENGSPAAEMIYFMRKPGEMVIEHTEVGEELKGQQAGFQLVRTAVEYARQHHIRIIPLCPFAHAVFKKKPEFADVLFQPI
ncbi:MAG TPA: GNAT family N-acetyltransferase [Chitinophagaceae bacterium]|nr:GNAT family N-acetyltransferase [Chitinophagaceae bacterium]